MRGGKVKKSNVILDSDDDEDTDIVDKNGKEGVVEIKESMPGSKTVIKSVKKEGAADSAKPELTFSDLVNDLNIDACFNEFFVSPDSS